MPSSASSPSVSLRDQLLREAVEMVLHAFALGKSVPTSVVDTVQQYESRPEGAPALDPAPLVLAHARLTRIVAPATPRTLVLLADEAATQGRLAFLGPVPLVRQLMVVAIVCVLAFVLISLAKATGSTNVTFVNTWGWRLLINELWWLTAAGVGASFARLFQVNEYIEKCNYNPRYASTYWVKFLLGVMAGYILVALLPFDLQGGQRTGLHLMQPAVALLGGYSASAVYRILTRLVEAVEAIFRGDAREVMAEREQAAAARAFEEASRARVRVAERLVDVQRQLATGATTDEVSATVRDIVASLTREVAEVEELPASAPAEPPPGRVTVDATPEALVAAAGRAREEPAREEEAAAG
ncbi:MAG TPA: hypothetical protein VFX98_07345 [Longimicrobiaceae bacterium]|nr:hypothetical protein [Longimicrobiaceae bacterium]